MEPGAIRQLLHGIDAMLTRAPDDPALLRRRADLLRASGDFSEARDAYARLTGCPESERARRILAGEAVNWDDRCGASPFVRIEQFLPAEQQAWLWATVGDPATEFFAGAVKGAGGETTNPNARTAQIMRRAGPVKQWFMGLVESAAGEAVLARLGMKPFEVGMRELQITRHYDGAHFRMHRDTGPAHPARYLSYIYYFHREPRPFDGGDLLLFDQNTEGRRSELLAFSRIAPSHNSLLLFPSDRLHSVSRVTSASNDLLDARWTVNGWLNRAEPQ